MRAASSRRFTKFLAHPEPSSRRWTALCGVGVAGRGESGEGRRKAGGEGQREDARSLQEREASRTLTACSLGAGLEPSRRRGAAEPSLVRLGRRPQQRNPGRRWAGGGSHRRAISEARAKRES